MFKKLKREPNFIHDKTGQKTVIRSVKKNLLGKLCLRTESDFQGNCIESPTGFLREIL